MQIRVKILTSFKICHLVLWIFLIFLVLSLKTFFVNVAKAESYVVFCSSCIDYGVNEPKWKSFPSFIN